MGHLLYLMFRCDFDVMESLDFVGIFGDLNTPNEKVERLGIDRTERIHRAPVN